MGQKIVQTAHIAAEFSKNFPTQYNTWLDDRSIIVFEVRNELALKQTKDQLIEKGCEVFEFFEPDYNQVTAIGIVPSEVGRKMTSSLKLVGKTKQDLYTDDVVREMIRTQQMENLSVLEHGIMVNDMFHRLLQCMRSGVYDFDRVPKWIKEGSQLLLDMIDSYSIDLINEYQIYHDCGKPFTEDVEGIKFYNHAQVSHDIWLKCTSNEFVANLMLHDMDMHTMKASDIDDFMKIDGYVILMLTSVAELYANSTMFGGTDSTSFKIKFKQLEKRGNAILKRLM